jgi:glycosyltransferase involved in cell wall biosynthesis
MAEGISFIIRARNEEATLEQCIRSLFDIQVPHEIIVILHCCTDRSKEIVEGLQREREKIKENSKIIIYEYLIEISRAGYETLATDKDSNHSLMTYYNWCLNKASFLWKCKWDADFIMTPELLNYINSNTELWKKHSKIIKLNAKNSTSVETYDYFSSCLTGYSKYHMWEVPYYNYYTDQYEVIHLNDIYITHCSELTNLKSYWRAEPWYKTEDSEEARIVQERINCLVRDFGPEPPGLARSCNPECNPLQARIIQANPSYINFTN